MKAGDADRGAPGEHWISLYEASELLGVSTSTLRRWGDTGKVPMKKTLGGHRRFPRATIMQLARSSASSTAVLPAPQPASPMWGVDAREMARQEWHVRLAARSAAARMRGLGQRLLGLLIQYVNRREDDQRFLEEARTVGCDYGREAHNAVISLHDTVEAFLFFRSSFSQLVMPLPGVAQPTSVAEAATLHARVNRFMDAVLLGVIAGYEGSRG